MACCDTFLPPSKSATPAIWLGAPGLPLNPRPLPACVQCVSCLGQEHLPDGCHVCRSRSVEKEDARMQCSYNFFFFNELPPHLLCQTLNGCTKLLKESYSDGYEYRKAPHASACLQRWDDTQVTYCVMKTHRGDTRLKLVPTALMFSFLFRLTCSWCNNDWMSQSKPKHKNQDNRVHSLLAVGLISTSAKNTKHVRGWWESHQVCKPKHWGVLTCWPDDVAHFNASFGDHECPYKIPLFPK